MRSACVQKYWPPVPSAPVSTSQGQRSVCGHCQTISAAGSDSGTQSRVVSNTIVFAGSLRDRNLMLIVTMPVIAAENTATRLAAVKPSVPGRTMTSTPMKPATTALQRRMRTTSPRNSTAPIVTNSGDE